MEKVLDINNSKGANYVTVNPQGTHIAFRYDGHLWIQNIDGSDLTGNYQKGFPEE